MDAALAAGLNTLRLWSHGVTAAFSSQPAPGAFAEHMFRGLDYALDQARQRKLKARPLHAVHGPLCRASERPGLCAGPGAAAQAQGAPPVQGSCAAAR